MQKSKKPENSETPNPPPRRRHHVVRGALGGGVNPEELPVWDRG